MSDEVNCTISPNGPNQGEICVIPLFYIVINEVKKFAIGVGKSKWRGCEISVNCLIQRFQGIYKIDMKWETISISDLKGESGDC